jgi:hypothetical protein
MAEAVFHSSYFTVMHCHPLSVSVAVVLTLVFTIGLAKTAPADWSHGERFFICCLLSLLGRMHNYCLLLLIWLHFKAPEPFSCDRCVHTTWAGSVVTKIYFSILTIPVPALSLGHALTTTPPI